VGETVGLFDGDGVVNSFMGYEGLLVGVRLLSDELREGH
jgi:hypothetical protein